MWLYIFKYVIAPIAVALITAWIKRRPLLSWMRDRPKRKAERKRKREEKSRDSSKRSLLSRIFRRAE